MDNSYRPLICLEYCHSHAAYLLALMLWLMSILISTFLLKSGGEKPPGEVMGFDDAHFPVPYVWFFYFMAQPV